jgi:hypothetical protein
MDEDRYRVIAVCLIVAIGLAYMGWLVVTYMEQRETGMTIRRTLSEWLDAQQTPPQPSEPVVSEVVTE